MVFGDPLRSNVDLPVTEFVATRSIALPLFHQITNEQLDEVCDTLRELLDQAPTLPLQPATPQ
jgi:dTDP-4-amino-4,6-dideoxygalactose transaminase